MPGPAVYGRRALAGRLRAGHARPLQVRYRCAVISFAFSRSGLKGLGFLILAGAGIAAYVKLHDRFSSKDYDPRGFTRSKYGTYGTAAWMSDKEMREILEVKSFEQADGVILGEKNGSAVCLPQNTRLNRHIAVFGASGTMKSRGVIRPALFTILKRGESAVITDPKGELYSDTAEMFRRNGYEVKVFNLVNPAHGDSWNCMSDLNGDTLLAQVLVNVIIANTSEGKGDHFWDNGEANLLKALVLYIDQDRSRSPAEKNLAAVYQLLTRNSERQLTALFEKLPLDHPARAPFNLFAQASDTVRSGIVLGLGTRLQVLQNEAVRNIISRSDIDLTAPGRRKCAYFVILSDQDTTMAFYHPCSSRSCSSSSPGMRTAHRRCAAQCPSISSLMSSTMWESWAAQQTVQILPGRSQSSGAGPFM